MFADFGTSCNLIKLLSTVHIYKPFQGQFSMQSIELLCLTLLAFSTKNHFASLKLIYIRMGHNLKRLCNDFLLIISLDLLVVSDKSFLMALILKLIKPE